MCIQKLSIVYFERITNLRHSYRLHINMWQKDKWKTESNFTEVKMICIDSSLSKQQGDFNFTWDVA